MRLRLAVLPALALVVSCARTPQAPPQPASRTATIDGRYAGSARGSCGAHLASADVRDGGFTLQIAGGETLHGTADPNGTLRGTALARDGREMNFTARVDGAELRGGSYNGRCALAFALTRTS